MIIKEEAHEKNLTDFLLQHYLQYFYNFITNFNNRNLHLFKNLWVLDNMWLQIWIQLIEIHNMYHISGGKIENLNVIVQCYMRTLVCTDMPFRFRSGILNIVTVSTSTRVYDDLIVLMCARQVMVLTRDNGKTWIIRVNVVSVGW
jgi:hypothetical protein